MVIWWLKDRNKKGVIIMKDNRNRHKRKTVEKPKKKIKSEKYD